MFYNYIFDTEGFSKRTASYVLIGGHSNSSNQSDTTLLYGALLLEDHGESDQSGTGLEFNMLKALTNGSAANWQFFSVSVVAFF